MVLTFDETAAELRSRTEAREIFGWNHRTDATTGDDVWIITFNEGHEFPRTVEWTQAAVERWIRQQDEAATILRQIRL